MDSKIAEYKLSHKKEEEKRNETQSPFKVLSQKYANIYSKEKIIEIYIEEMKKDLCQNIGCSDSKSEKSMNSESSDTQFIHMMNMQDAQDLDEEIIEDITIQTAFEELKNSLKDNFKKNDS